ncbi:MAG: nucleotidyltransferase family protein [Nocardioidaceae bacterium]
MPWLDCRRGGDHRGRRARDTHAAADAPPAKAPVARRGIPFVVHLVAKLSAAGVKRVLLATSYHADQFEPVLGNGNTWDVELIYVREAEPLGTGGAIRNAAALLTSGSGEPVVVLNGDILSGHSLSDQLTHHRDQDAEVTLHLVEVDDARAFGSVPTSFDGSVTGFVEKSSDPVSRHINAGCYIFDRSIIDDIPAGEVVSVERETFPGLLAKGRRVMGHVEAAYWRDVGTPSALREASVDLVLGKVKSPAYPFAPGECWVSDAAVSRPVGRDHRRQFSRSRGGGGFGRFGHGQRGQR